MCFSFELPLLLFWKKRQTVLVIIHIVETKTKEGGEKKEKEEWRSDGIEIRFL